MNKSDRTIRLTLLQRAGRAVIALVFVVWHAYIAMLVLAEAMVNGLARTNTRLTQALEVTFGSAMICSLLLFVASVAGWRRQTLVLLGALLVLSWLVAFWLV